MKFGAFPVPDFISLSVAPTTALGLLGFTGILRFLDSVHFLVCGFWVGFFFGLPSRRLQYPPPRPRPAGKMPGLATEGNAVCI